MKVTVFVGLVFFVTKCSAISQEQFFGGAQDLLDKQTFDNQHLLVGITSDVEKQIAAFDSDINKLASTMKSRAEVFFNSLKAKTSDATIQKAISNNQYKYSKFISNGQSALNSVASELTTDLSAFLPVLSRAFAARSIIDQFFGSDFKTRAVLAAQTNPKVFTCAASLSYKVQVLMNDNTERVRSCAFKQELQGLDRIASYRSLVQSLVSAVFENEQNMSNNLDKCVASAGLDKNLIMTKCAPMITRCIDDNYTLIRSRVSMGMSQIKSEIKLSIENFEKCAVAYGSEEVSNFNQLRTDVDNCLKV